MNKQLLYGAENPVFSIVIPAYNEEDFLPQCLRSLQAQKFEHPFEVIVVDNNSSDNTAKVAESFGAKVVLETTRGVCAARQAGTELAKATIVISTDADTTYNKNWLSNIHQAFDSHPEAVAIAGSPHFTDAPLWIYTIVWLITTFVRLVYAVTGSTFYVSAANFAFRKSAFDKYNTKLTQGGDEVYLLKQLKKKGKVVPIFNNPVFTSSRRIQRGFLYNIAVTWFMYYFIEYNLSRFTGRTVFGAYPAFRTNKDLVLRKRNLQMGALAFMLIAALWVWRTDNVRVAQAEKRIQGLEQRIRSLGRQK
jgi:glycosyltransferase involved in cell wall biosynthesis